MDADGENRRQLTFAPGDDASPHWAPNGRTLTFISDRDGRSNPYAIDVRRGRSRRLAYDGEYSDWTLDRRVLFTDSNGNLWNVSPYGGRRHFEHRADFDVQFLGVRVSDDDRMIVFASADVGAPHRILTATPDGGNQTLVLKSTLNVFYPVWSPDREWITFSAGTTGSGRSDVYVVRVNGTELARLTKSIRVACCSDWSDKAKMP